MPHEIRPMLAELIDEPFSDPNWVFEIKYDGYRAIAEIEDGEVSLYSRNFNSFNKEFKPVVESLKSLPNCILDGEITILDDKGRPEFQLLQNYKRTKKGNLVYFVFDCLYLGGRDFREEPLIQRKEILKKLLESHTLPNVQYSQHLFEKGDAFFKEAQNLHLEGIIGKKADSQYVSSRSKDWVKIKTHGEQEAVICGYTEPQKSRKFFGSLVLGIYEGEKLTYIGNVGTGFSESGLKELYHTLQPLKQKECPFPNPPSFKATWVKPKLLCEVVYSELTEDGRLRQPVFKGLRKDKSPSEVTREVALTNLNKVFWPDEGYTKGDMIEFYQKISDYILPYLKDRPQSMHRFPNGIQKSSFFQKNLEHAPSWIETFPIESDTKDKVVDYLLIQNQEALIYAANLACIELHPFHSKIQSLEYPDYLILDLDPEDMPFSAVVEVAKTVHEICEEVQIPSYCKTSGATGLHICIPLNAQYTYDQGRDFAELLCRIVHQRIPHITSLERMKSKRQRKVYLDYMQNYLGKTIAAPYCLRPFPGAPVSTPLNWDELNEKLDPKDFNIKNIFERLQDTGDLFKPVIEKGIDLPKALKRIEKIY